MSLCAPCTQLMPVDICATSIIIGEVPLANTEYNIYFRSLANGFVIKYRATSDGSNILTLTPNNGFVLATEMVYEVWVNRSTTSDCGDDLIICSTTARCFTVIFQRTNSELIGEQEASETNIQELKTIGCC